MTFDPITLEIQWQRLVNIVDEIDNAVIRTSFSTIVGESHDFGCLDRWAVYHGRAESGFSACLAVHLCPQREDDHSGIVGRPLQLRDMGSILAGRRFFASSVVGETELQLVLSMKT